MNNITRNGVLSAILTLGVLMMWQPLFAHHGSNNYDITRSVTLKGTVTQWVWSNPHCQLYFDVTDEKGNVQHWGSEMPQPRALAVQGFTRDIMKPGDMITITGRPARSGTTRMFGTNIVLANGKHLPEKTGIDQNGSPNPIE